MDHDSCDMNHVAALMEYITIAASTAECKLAYRVITDVLILKNSYILFTETICILDRNILK